VTRYYQLIHRYSSNLAFLSDYAMFILGGQLKRKEKLSARLGDLLSNLYLASAVLQRFYHDGEPVEDLPLVDWCCQQLFYECDIAILGVIANFPGTVARMILKTVVQPFGLKRRKPSDKLGHEVACLMTEPSETRKRLTRFVFQEDLINCPVGRIEAAFHKIVSVEDLEKTISRAVKEGSLHTLTWQEQIDEAAGLGLVSASEATQLQAAEIARQYVIAVDDFDDSELRRQSSTV